MEPIERQEENPLHKNITIPNSIVDFLIDPKVSSELNIFGYRVLYCIFSTLYQRQIFRTLISVAKKKLEYELYWAKLRGFASVDRQVNHYDIENFIIKDYQKKQQELHKSIEMQPRHMICLGTKHLSCNNSICVSNFNVFVEQLAILSELDVETRLGKRKFLASFYYDSRKHLFTLYFSNDVLFSLLDTTPGFDRLNIEFFFSQKNPRSIITLLLLKRRFGFRKKGEILISEFVRSIGLPDRYQTPSRLQSLLEKIQKFSEDFGHLTFSFKIIGRAIRFELLKVKRIHFEPQKITNKSQITSALKYLKRTRNLDKEHILLLRKYYNNFGYDKIREILRFSTFKNLNGAEFMKELILRLSS